FCRWRRHRFSLFKNIGIPGPEPSLFTGNIYEIIEKGAVRMFDEWVNKYGDVVGFYNGVTPMLIVKDLELIKNIQIKDFGNFHGRGVTSKLFRNHQVGKLKLINVDGDRWKYMRSLLTPAFTSSNMKKARRDDLLQLILNAETEEGAAVNVHKLTVEYDDDVSKPTDTNLNARKKMVLSNAEVDANAQVFLIAGTETSRTALTFTSYLLAKFQDVQDRLRSEITGVLERDGKFSYDNVFSMRYLDQVISESLRFYPPVTGFITRTCQHDYEYNGLKIPAGMSVLIPPYQLHHDPNLWSEPEKFDPER
ncbi:unnamed protein product, partial [Ixodes persulcatus]